MMVGEIRDVETAQIAVQASLTGHLVFSTVHTNSAVAAIARLRDMGVEPYLMASTLRLVLAQRLVRRLCDACKRPGVIGPREGALLATIGAPSSLRSAGLQGLRRVGVYRPHRPLRMHDGGRRDPSDDPRQRHRTGDGGLCLRRRRPTGRQRPEICRGRRGAA